MQNITKIIIHHSLTKDSGTVSWGAIRNYHINKNRFSDIGYHFGIEKLRNNTEIVIGRMIDISGAHCRGHNNGTIGICFVGNFDIVTPPLESWSAGIKLITFLIKEYCIKKVEGHNELNPNKTCPGRLFDLNRFRKEIELQL